MKKKSWLVAKILVSALGLYFVFTNTEVTEAASVLESTSLYYFIPALFLYLISKFFTAIRFRYLLQSYNCQLPYLYNLQLYLAGMYYNLILPGGVSGDIYKAYVINKKYSLEIKELLLISLKDRIYGAYAIAVLIAVLLCVSPQYNQYTLFYFLLILASYIAYFLITRKFFSKLISSFNISLILSLFGQLLQVIAFLFLLSMINVQDNWVEYAGVFFVSSLIASLPITIGGIGAREVTFYYFASLFSINTNQAVMASILFYLITVLSSLLGLPYSWLLDVGASQRNSSLAKEKA